jgi:hypothetical protein
MQPFATHLNKIHEERNTIMQQLSIPSLAHPVATTQSAVNAGAIWIKVSVVYLIIGVAMGIFMGASQDFTLRPVHAHVNLLGFTTLAIAGVIYSVYPKAGGSMLAKAHFWLMNLSLPVMMIALALVLKGNLAVVPALVVAAVHQPGPRVSVWQRPAERSAVGSVARFAGTYGPQWRAPRCPHGQPATVLKMPASIPAP